VQTFLKKKPETNKGLQLPSCGETKYIFIKHANITTKINAEILIENIFKNTMEKYEIFGKHI